MKEPKRYYCGNGEGMFEDDKNGHWVEYSEHKAIVDALTKQLRKHDVVGRSEQLFCPDCKHNTRMQNGFIWCENDDCGGIYRTN